MLEVCFRYKSELQNHLGGKTAIKYKMQFKYIISFKTVIIKGRPHTRLSKRHKKRGRVSAIALLVEVTQ